MKSAGSRNSQEFGRQPTESRGLAKAELPVGTASKDDTADQGYALLADLDGPEEAEVLEAITRRRRVVGK